MAKKYDDEFIAKMIALHNDGMLVKDIVEQHKVSSATLSKWIKSDKFNKLNKLNGEEFFWAIMDLCNWKHEGDDGKVLAPVIKQLASMEDEKIFDFEKQMTKLLYDLDTEKLILACEKEDDCVSDDSFLYSRCVALINGKDYYNRVKAGKITELWTMEFESILYVSRRAWELKYGNDDFPYIDKLSYETGSNEKGWE